MHKGVKNKAKLSNCDKCEYSRTKNDVPVMHKFRKYEGQEPPKKFCKLCDFTCLTSGGLMFHQNVEHLRIQGPQELKWVLCDYTASKNDTLSKHRIREHGILKYLSSYVCTENIKVLSPSQIMSATFSIKEVLVMHMHKVHKGDAPVQKSCDMCLFTSHLSRVLKNHINRKHL